MDGAPTPLKAPTRQDTPFEIFVRETITSLGPWVVKSMYAITVLTSIALVYRLVSIFIEFRDPVKFEEREAARRAKAAKKAE